MDSSKLETLPYRELQRIAKGLGLKANGKKNEILALIILNKNEKKAPNENEPIIYLEASQLNMTYDVSEEPTHVKKSVVDALSGLDIVDSGSDVEKESDVTTEEGKAKKVENEKEDSEGIYGEQEDTEESIKETDEEGKVEEDGESESGRSSNNSMSSDDEEFNPDGLVAKESKEEYDSNPSDTDGESEEECSEEE
jgi:hypothetical protein